MGTVRSYHAAYLMCSPDWRRVCIHIDKVSTAKWHRPAHSEQKYIHYIWGAQETPLLNFSLVNMGVAADCVDRVPGQLRTTRGNGTDAQLRCDKPYCIAGGFGSHVYETTGKKAKGCELI